MIDTVVMVMVTSDDGAIPITQPSDHHDEILYLINLINYQILIRYRGTGTSYKLGFILPNIYQPYEHRLPMAPSQLL